ncbi:hypothetical protein HZ994_01080 [Akkermansiaceae bacterium]|nr:hypothetical protein HZ994_01080 [Akkermansiaceae bacterium]
MKAILMLLVLSAVAHAAPKQIRVFVALCDNKTQGIVPVGEKIGNGDDPDANLYWGCTDGLAVHFRKSENWKQVKSEKDVSKAILRRLTFKHTAADIELVADAYRGSEMGACIVDFEKAAAGGKYDPVAFIGHNGLMDFPIDPPAKVEGNDTDVAVLCCLSESYFKKRLEALGCRPVLMTRQLMYPGSFILSSSIESWRKGEGRAEIRSAAGRAYAKNQKISAKAATGVFADLGE